MKFLPNLVMRSIVFSFIIFISGCSKEKSSTLLGMDYLKQDRMLVNASSVQVNSSEISADDTSGISPISLSEMTKQWAKEFFQTDSRSTNILRVSISKANISEIRLPTKTGLSAPLYIENSEKYKGTLAVTFCLIDPLGKILKETSVTISDEEFLRENIPLSERKLHATALCERLINTATNIARNRLSDILM
ncbi:hypothetical protein [Candidatus Hydrogenosomobacter endosymbioticus]|uniref:Lipoprotein n=1 Tax=Candidatus Hydrogenosomobacter endosymbioticus TaxID=2558174 RepID=A0ABM7V8Y3_9PROT|nr:hypothetical protein [Candidatus Hydrogenosomobacter endosymbioticus]BDB96263.1 hypothetical protein HYD_3960 [Candidatus Hydrogenosomobacter endosymbioticus]